MIITIDGPVASGKSSVARSLAQKLDFYYLNTGFLYRGVAYILQQKNISQESLSSLDWSDLLFVQDFVYQYQDQKPRLLYNNQDITPLLYSSQIDQLASQVSAHVCVREALLGLQRQIGREHNIVTDGRDCGSVVFPDAAVKFYLTADAAVRATRLMSDEGRDYACMTLDQAIAAVKERDTRDQTRDIAPLKVPDNALIIDNSLLTMDQTLEVMLQIVKSGQ